ncbi:MAG: cysteine desulfurase family protein [Gammaproteobacteria bacterium]|nr:MAG: cysteine desulfurase family protein [Gammaproteobacteria bacterium]
MTFTYLDHNATTPLLPVVKEAMAPYWQGVTGNPSSMHRSGRMARAAVEQARDQVAELVGAHASQVVFTSGGTEANNLALKGMAGYHPAGLLLVGATEHASVQETAVALSHRGWLLEKTVVENRGRVLLAQTQSTLAQAPAMVSVMWANNETGVIEDIPALAEWAQAQGAVMHSDAVQAAGKVEIDFAGSGVQLMSVSAHKLGGPKGVGALIVDKSLTLEPLLHGGGHEKGYRSGTENVAGIVGFGVAAMAAQQHLQTEGRRLRTLRQQLERGLLAVTGIEVVAQDAERLPNTVCFIIPGVDAEMLVNKLDRAGFAVSSGSACGSHKAVGSSVLAAMGYAPDMAQAALRVSLGQGNTEQDIERFLTALAAQLQQLMPGNRRSLA